MELPETLDRACRPFGKPVGTVGGEFEGVGDEGIRRQEVRGLAAVTGPVSKQSQQHALGGLQTHALRVSDIVIATRA